jgi:hypothetical protein
VIAVWCFIQNRFGVVGIFCMAVSLLIKPHDSGFIWLYFLLAGGIYRKRALQTLAFSAFLAIPAILWVTHVAPNWLQELRSNLAVISSRGGFNDPGPASFVAHTAGSVIDLQAVISVFRDDPRWYNPIAYATCAALILPWALFVLRSNLSPKNTWAALAAVASITMLITYHKPVDARLFLLCVPACALLWAEGGTIGNIALAVTAASIVFTSDIPLAVLANFTKNLNPGTNLLGKIATVLLTRPAPVVLLMMAICYLWIYVRSARNRTGAETTRNRNERMEYTGPVSKEAVS